MLFASDEEDNDLDMKINEDFAKKFEHNEKRKEIEKLESKYGKSNKQI